MKASRAIYSIPNDKAKEANNITSNAVIIDKLSKQKTKLESIKSKHKKHLPKST